MIGDAVVTRAFAGLVFTNDGTVTTILGIAGDYVRIGDAGVTGHSLASEDDLLVTGKLEVDGLTYLDGAVTLGGTVTLGGQAFDAGAGELRVTSTVSSKGLRIVNTQEGTASGNIMMRHITSSPAIDDQIFLLIGYS